MRYGSFNDEKREYVITRPDTPRTWLNYIGSRLYGGIITQNAGGYSFYKSGGAGRILRMRFNSIPNDEPGRYLYLRDDNDGDFWSASWQPVGKPLDQYQSQVRHVWGTPSLNQSIAISKVRLPVLFLKDRLLNIGYSILQILEARTVISQSSVMEK
jgi:N,N'-diacetylchitobiose phosphorylase